MGRLYYRVLGASFGLSLLVCLASRILLMMRFIDYGTGFYTQDTGISLVFNFFLGASLILWFLSNRLKITVHDYPVGEQSAFAGALSVLVGIAIVLYMLLDSPYPNFEQGYSAIWLTLRNIASVVLGLLAAAAMALFGIAALTGKSPKIAMVPALFSSLWQVYMLVTRFNSYTTLTTISDNLLSVLFMVFASLFLTGHARTMLGFARKNGRNYTIPSGFAAALCGLCLTIPNYIAVLTGRSPTMPALVLGTFESVYVLLLSLYAVVYTFGMIRSIKYV